MKFPAVFRVFASLNMVVFLMLLLQSIVFYVVPEKTGFTISAVSTAIMVWVLVVSFFWFFGSSRSSQLLLITAISFLLLAVGAVYMGYFSDQLRDGEDIVFFIYALLSALYAVFMIVSLFFKPVVEWEKSVGRSSPVLSWGLFGSVFVLTFAVYYLADRSDKKFIVIEAPSSETRIWGDTALVDLQHLSEFDGLVISKDDESKSFKAAVAYSTNWDAQVDGDYFRVDTLLFEPLKSGAMQKGNYISMVGALNSVNLLARLPAVKARKIKVVLLEGSSMLAHSFQFTFVHSEGHFARNTSLAQYVASDDQHPVPEAYGDEYEGNVDESIITTAMKSLAESEQHALINFFINHICENYDNQVGYQFNTNHPRVVLNNKPFGMYENFHTLFDSYGATPLVQLLSERGGGPSSDDMSLNDVVIDVTGVSLYREIPSLPYQGLNPDFVNWLRSFMLVSTDDRFYNLAAQEIYTNMFRRMVWMMAAAHEYTASAEDTYSMRATEYLERMSETGFRGNDYLYEKYGNIEVSGTSFQKVYNEYPADTENEYFYFNEQVAIGFWLRRRLDGSEAEVWNLVQEVLVKYDNYPMDGQEGN